MQDSPVRESRAASLVEPAELDGRTVRGYAAVYDTPWDDRLTEQNGYVEEIARGAFRRGLSRSTNIPLLWQHERRDMLATTNAETLRLKDEPKGLYFEAELPENPLGDYVRSMVKRGDVRGVSYGVKSAPHMSTITRKDGVMHRRINDFVSLDDVSLTYEPSYPDATVELRSMGFTALPLQALVEGLEDQLGEAATDTSSPVVPPGRFSDFELELIARGGWTI